MNRRLLFCSLLFVGFLFSFEFSGVAQTDVMTNEEVITLKKAGLGDSVIIGKIRSSKSNFDTSTDALIRLKQSGVTDAVIGAMFEAKSNTHISIGGAPASTSNDPNDPMGPHNVGIYYYSENAGVRKMDELESNVVTQSRSGGMFGTALTYGIMKTKIKAKVPGTSANKQIADTQPVFYFYLNEKDTSMRTVQGFPASVNQFQLVRFHVKDKGREVTVGKVNAFGGKFGISDEYLVEFAAEKVRDGVFKVTPRTPIGNGEYGFYLIGTGEGTGATFFDFGIKLVP